MEEKKLNELCAVLISKYPEVSQSIEAMRSRVVASNRVEAIVRLTETFEELDKQPSDRVIKFFNKGSKQLEYFASLGTPFTGKWWTGVSFRIIRNLIILGVFFYLLLKAFKKI